MSTLPAKEQLDIRDVDDEQLLYEPLEIETGSLGCFLTGRREARLHIDDPETMTRV